jgi:hypothetical protein
MRPNTPGQSGTVPSWPSGKRRLGLRSGRGCSPSSRSFHSRIPPTSRPTWRSGRRCHLAPPPPARISCSPSRTARLSPATASATSGGRQSSRPVYPHLSGATICGTSTPRPSSVTVRASRPSRLGLATSLRSSRSRSTGISGPTARNGRGERSMTSSGLMCQPRVTPQTRATDLAAQPAGSRSEGQLGWNMCHCSGARRTCTSSSAATWRMTRATSSRSESVRVQSIGGFTTAKWLLPG